MTSIHQRQICEKYWTVPQYDDLGRLISENSSTGYVIGYSYDSFSNRNALNYVGDEEYQIIYEYDLDNRLLEERKITSLEQQIKNYYYDRNGNMTAIVPSSLSPHTSAPATKVFLSSGLGAATLFDYDGFNRQVKASTGETVAKYTYLPQGLRYSKDIDGETVYHIWNGDKLVADLTESGTSAKYIYGLTLLSGKLSGTTQQYLFNAHGDVTALVNQQTITQRYAYDAFGNRRELAGYVIEDDSNPFRYCGEYFDTETETVYLRARYYNPSNGRFTQRDNISEFTYELPNGKEVPDPLSLNYYTYCHNNPILYVDHQGASVLFFMAAGFLIGGLASLAVSIPMQLAFNGRITFFDSLIAFFAGGASGALAATGIGLGGQILGNALIGALSNSVKQGHEIYTGQSQSFDVVSLLMSTIVGAVAGIAGRAGTGHPQMSQASGQLFKRMVNAIMNSSSSGGVMRAIGKALAYYAKSTKFYYVELVKGIIRAAGVEFASNLIHGISGAIMSKEDKQLSFNIIKQYSA